MIQEGFPKHEWTTRLAAEERGRDAVIALAVDTAAHDTALVAANGPRLVESLAMTIAEDIARFRDEFPENSVRHLVLGLAPNGGFEVQRRGYPAVSLMVTPDWTSRTVTCRYRFIPAEGVPAREDGFVLGFRPLADQTCFEDQGSGEVFRDLPVLSEYLLTPLFTGRARVVGPIDARARAQE